VKRLIAFLRQHAGDPTFWDGLAFLAVLEGSRRLWERTMTRLAELEEARGMVPLDDVVTVGDLDRTKREVLQIVDERLAGGS
jgi:hypothetical protein